MAWCSHSVNMVKLPQQTRDVEPMLFWYWADVEDGGPTSKQHWFNVLCLLAAGLILYTMELVTGFSPGMFERGVQKGWRVWGPPPSQEKKIQNFKFWCLKWPIWNEMTIKYGISFNFSCQQGGPGDIPPLWCWVGGVRTPHAPLSETWVTPWIHTPRNQCTCRFIMFIACSVLHS